VFFVVDKPRLQRLIAITRDDRRPDQQGKTGPYYRIEAREGRVRLTGREVEAEFPATVYEEGVLFLRVTLFRRLLASFTNTPTIAVQVREDGLHFGDVTMPLEGNDMLLYLDPARAPRVHPSESADEHPPAQGTLFPE
jgi:hypothetical protein